MVSFVSRLKGSAKNFRLPFLSPSSFGRRAPMMSAAMSTVSSRNIKSPPEKPLTSSKPVTLPWLMLPPKAGDDTMLCKFYDLVEDRVESLRVELPYPDDIVLVGSSHGWLAFFDRRTKYVYLSNPFAGRLLKLPSIDTLLDTDMKLGCGSGTISKLILSSSAAREDCIAMISFGPGHKPAFCYPISIWGRSDRWDSLNDDPLYPDGLPKYTDARTYEDLVYRSSQKIFSFITEFQIAHDCGEPLFPSRLEEYALHSDFSFMIGRHQLEAFDIPYLLFNEQCGGLYIMTRFLSAGHKTIGFFAFKVEYHECGMFQKKLILVDSLDGLAVFVGLNHSFAVSSPAEFGLKPDSIYFTDAANARVMPPAIHGHDNGVFDYVNKTLSPCPGPYYDDAQTLSTPVWFTPSPY
ncbi:hypothetical protein CASFOL_005707 [Castilleja foliolosa]|uniref:KIB1-4 beta-propeller domain-containing protein n=1 Tax=Castilleja foliolosa TaxID=1961234 RepID=A0ABD3E5A2_9LAMI